MLSTQVAALPSTVGCTAFALAPCVWSGKREKKEKEIQGKCEREKCSIIARARSRQANLNPNPNPNANAGQSHKLNAFSMCLATDYGRQWEWHSASDLAGILHLFHFISVNLAEL